MGYHRQIKLKIEGKQIVPISEYEIKRRKIKHLQRYKNNFQNVENEKIPELISKFYSYLLKKSIIPDTEFIKNEVLFQIDAIIDAYRNSYNPSELHKIKRIVARMGKEQLGCDCKKPIDKVEHIRELSNFAKSDFYAAKHYIFSDYI